MPLKMESILVISTTSLEMGCTASECMVELILIKQRSLEKLDKLSQVQIQLNTKVRVFI